MGDTYNLSGDFRYATLYIKSTITGQEIRIPFQRPPRADYFTNRKSELEQLLNDLQPGQVVTLCGPGGIGKSALAAEAIWRLTPQNTPPEKFPDGIIFHNFYNQPQAALAMENIALSFGEDLRPTPRDAALRALAGKKALLLLDGTEDVDNLSAVLSVAGDCGVLVTSRNRQDATAQRQDIEPLEKDESIALLQAWGQEQASDKTAVGRICELVDGLPLAVRLVGRYLKQTDEAAQEYLKWLQTTPIRALTQGEHKEDSVAVLLERSLKQVSQEAATVLAVVGRLALAGFSLEPIAAALALESRPIRNLLNELISYGLLLKETFLEGKTEQVLLAEGLTLSGEWENSDPKIINSSPPLPALYSVSHTLVHTYANKRLTVTDDIMARLVEYYIELIETESKKGPEGYRRLDTERGHILQVLVGCVEREDWVETQRLVLVLKNYLDMQGYWTEWVKALELGVVAAQQAGNRHNEGEFLNFLGSAYWSMGQMEKAIKYYEKSLANNRENSNREGEGRALGNLGLAYNSLGQVEKAIEYYEQALTINQEVGNRHGESIWLSSLGITYRNLGQAKKAIEYYEQALSISREIGYRQHESNCLGNLGNAYSDLGQVEGDKDHTGAIEYYEQALSISREIGYRRGEGIWLENLADGYRKLNQPEQALRYIQEGLLIVRQIKALDLEAWCLWRTGQIYQSLGDMAQARDYGQQSVAIFEVLKFPQADEVRKWLAELGE